MKIKKILIPLLAVLFCTLLIGYFAKETIIKKVRNYAVKDKVVYKVNAKNATQISYKKITYQISNASLDRSKIGGWNGIIDRVVVIDKNNHIISQKEINSSATLMIKDIKRNFPKDAKCVVSFQSVCSIKNVDNKAAIAVQINNNFYKAVPIKMVSTDEITIK